MRARWIPMLIGVGLALIWAFAFGLSGQAQTGVPADPRLSRVVGLLNRHPELREHFQQYIRLSEDLEATLFFLDPVLEALNSLEELKGRNLPRAGSAWNALCTGLRISGADICGMLDSLRDGLAEIQEFRERVRRWRRLESTIVAMDALLATPNEANLQVFLASAGEAQGILQEAQKDIGRLEDITAQLLSQGASVHAALSSFSGNLLVEDAVAGLENLLKELEGPLHDFQRSLQQSRENMRADLRTQGKITGQQPPGQGGGTIVLILLAVALAGIVFWRVARRRKEAPIPAHPLSSSSVVPDHILRVERPASPAATMPPARPSVVVNIARLIVLLGPLQGFFVPLAKDNISIGRGAGNDLSIPDSMVSRHHCRLRLAQGVWYLQNQGSTNGTFVNGQRISATRLQGGDRIRIGQTEMRFEYLAQG